MRIVTVIGLDGPELSAAAQRALAGATLVIGARQHLAWADHLIDQDAPRMELGPLKPALEALGDRKGPAVVLASGDPGWFGIVRTLGDLPPGVLRVLPAPSSLSRLAAACGQPWDQIVTFSAHGRDPRPAVNAARALPAVAVLTGPGLTVHDLATALDGWPRTLTVGQRLGHPDERVITCAATEALDRTWTVPNLVLVTDPSRARPGPVLPVWGLPESEYEHRDRMITKAEVRAWVVAQLSPAPGRLVWDLGAGSGSVGLECAHHGAAVIAVEADSDSTDRIARNAIRHQVCVRIVPGRAPQVLAGLPEPDAVFVGGGGPPIVAAVAGLAVPRVVVACAVLDHALASRDILRSSGYLVSGAQLTANRLAELPGGGVRLAATNPTIVLTATLPTIGANP